MNLSIERLREVLDYNDRTGIFTWRATLSNRSPKGSIAGKKPNSHGYCVIRIDGFLYGAHRLAWFHYYGVLPDDEIDHRNGIKSDNKIINLRIATTSQNKMNSKKHQDNSSGFKGVFWEKNCSKWRATICVNRQKINLGLFKSKEEAAKKYDEAALAYHGYFANLNSGE